MDEQMYLQVAVTFLPNYWARIRGCIQQPSLFDAGKLSAGVVFRDRHFSLDTSSSVHVCGTERDHCIDSVGSGGRMVQ